MALWILRCLESCRIWDRNPIRRPHDSDAGLKTSNRYRVLQYDTCCALSIKETWIQSKENTFIFSKINVDCGEKVEHIYVRTPI